MNMKERLFELSKADAIGNISEASDLAFNMLCEHIPCERGKGLTFFGFLKGESDYTIMLDSHIDEIGMIVTDVSDDGFLTVSNVGGIDIRALPSRRVKIHGKEEIIGVFAATPPHLSQGEEQYTDITQLKIDTVLGKRAKEVISVGDFVTFCKEPKELLNERVTGACFDDRAGVVCLIETAIRLKEEKLPVNVVFSFTDGEELGLRGIRPAAFKINPDEAVAIDVTFGTAADVKAEESGELSKGALIGVSPCLDSTVSKKMISLAKEKEIPYQIEVMSATSGTNADMLSVTREGVKTGTLSIPLRNMHTDCEILDLKDLEYTVEMLCEYVRNGGVKNA